MDANKATKYNIHQREMLSFLLGVQGLSLAVITSIVETYPTWNLFQEATNSEIRAVTGVGAKTAKEIYNARINREREKERRLIHDQRILEAAATKVTATGRDVDQRKRPESVWLCCRKVGRQIDADPKKLYNLVTTESIPVGRLFDAAAGVPEAIDQLVEDMQANKETTDDRPGRLKMALWLISQCGSSQAALDAVMGAARGLGETITIKP